MTHNIYTDIVKLHYTQSFFHRYAILNEVWNLVEDGILSVEDVDKVISEGLGMRYAFIGALETAHLNAEGNV